MAGSVFIKAVEAETGITWETWLKHLTRVVDSLWSHEQISEYLADEYNVPSPWSKWIALVYEQQIDRKPVGVTAGAGVNIGREERCR